MDAFNIFLILCGAALFLLIAAIVLMGFYHLGFESGIVREKLRWHQMEMQIERRMLEDAFRDRDEIRQTELDAG